MKHTLAIIILFVPTLIMMWADLKKQVKLPVLYYCVGWFSGYLGMVALLWACGIFE